MSDGDQNKRTQQSPSVSTRSDRERLNCGHIQADPTFAFATAELDTLEGHTYRGRDIRLSLRLCPYCAGSLVATTVRHPRPVEEFDVRDVSSRLCAILASIGNGKPLDPDDLFTVLVSTAEGYRALCHRKDSGR